MKKLWIKWTEIALVKRILVGLILGAILGIAVPELLQSLFWVTYSSEPSKRSHRFLYFSWLSVLCAMPENLTAVLSKP